MYLWKEPKYTLIQTREQLIEVASLMEKAIDNDEIISIDIETNGPFAESGLNWTTNWLLGMSFCWNIHEGYYLPFNHTIDGVRDENQVTVAEASEILNPIVSTKGVYLGHNLKFDYKGLWQAGIYLYPQLWDSMIAYQLYYSTSEDWVRKSAGLKNIIKEIVDIPDYKIQSFSDVAQGEAAETSIEDMKVYAINDVIFTYYLYLSLKPLIEDRCEKLFYEAELPLIPILANMELHGIALDVEYLRSLEKPMTEYKQKIADFFMNKYNVNIGSTLQLGRLLKKFEGVKLPETAKGGVSTDAKAMEKLQRTSKTKNPEVYKIASRVLRYRGLDKAIGTYIKKFPDIAQTYYKGYEKPIHVIHTNYNQIVASGRMSSAPNVQNLPKSTVVDIRKGFIPRPGYVFTSADLASAELRIATAISQEPKMLKAYLDDPLGADLHAMTAKGLFDVEHPSDEQRSIGKTFNFALLYGATEYSIAKTLKISLEEAKVYVDKYRNTYPGLMEWKDKIEHQIATNRYTETVFGRRRYLKNDVHPQMGKYEHWKYEAEVRALFNHIIQGTCADIIKFSMVKLTNSIAKQGADARLVNQVHDEIVIENNCPDIIEPIMKEIMEVNLKGVFMPIDITTKKTFSKKVA